MKSVTFIIQSHLDWDRVNRMLTPEWVRYRLDFYHKFTLPSLLNQSFADFRIFVYCGQRHHDLTESYPWHERVEPCYNLGRSKLAAINTDYISITRIDSDDLMHRDAMAEIRDNINLADGKDRECLIFWQNLKWSIVNRLIGHDYMKSGPFFTHVFPKRVYGNWPLYRSLHFLTHGRASPNAKELSKHKICWVKHWQNDSLDKQGLKPKCLTEEERLELAATHSEVILDRDKIIEILKDFAVKEEDIK